uniref:Uncharacterized protein n=1 Tax=Oryza brachyantha TaxID=4533 RepID=J3MD84_ORYBR
MSGAIKIAAAQERRDQGSKPSSISSTQMSSNFSFLEMALAKIAEELHTYGLILANLAPLPVAGRCLGAPLSHAWPATLRKPKPMPPRPPQQPAADPSHHRLVLPWPGRGRRGGGLVLPWPG